jgi:ABC-type Zn uptake system ZnuABC Zn-binding protein ZnuA
MRQIMTLGAGLILLAAGCTTPEPSDGAALRVVATTTQVGSVAAEVGGDAIELTVLLAPGVEAHDFELTPEAGAALERADVVLVSGAGLEAWLDDTLDTIGVGDRVHDLSAGVELRAQEEDGSVDPHYWLSGPNAVVMVENARDALVAALPAQEDGFADRAATLVDRLQGADAEVRALIGEVPPDERQLVTDHDALGYFIDEYGLVFVGSIFPSLDVSSEPSAQEIDALVAAIREEGVVAIFTESSVNPALARAIAEEADARVVDEPLYTDSLGPAGSGADTLDGMLLHNARVIRDGLLGG